MFDRHLVTWSPRAAPSPDPTASRDRLPVVDLDLRVFSCAVQRAQCAPWEASFNPSPACAARSGGHTIVEQAWPARRSRAAATSRCMQLQGRPPPLPSPPPLLPASTSFCTCLQATCPAAWQPGSPVTCGGRPRCPPAGLHGAAGGARARGGHGQQRPRPAGTGGGLPQARRQAAHRAV